MDTIENTSRKLETNRYTIGGCQIDETQFAAARFVVEC